MRGDKDEKKFEDPFIYFEIVFYLLGLICGISLFVAMYVFLG